MLLILSGPKVMTNLGPWLMMAAGAWQENDESYIVGEWEEPLGLDAQEVAHWMIGVVQEVAEWANRA